MCLGKKLSRRQAVKSRKKARQLQTTDLLPGVKKTTLANRPPDKMNETVEHRRTRGGASDRAGEDHGLGSREFLATGARARGRQQSSRERGTVRSTKTGEVGSILSFPEYQGDVGPGRRLKCGSSMKYKQGGRMRRETRKELDHSSHLWKCARIDWDGRGGKTIARGENACRKRKRRLKKKKGLTRCGRKDMKEASRQGHSFRKTEGRIFRCQPEVRGFTRHVLQPGRAKSRKVSRRNQISFREDGAGGPTQSKQRSREGTLP